MFPSLNNYNFSGKRVLVRCDFNVPIEQGKVLDDFKLQSTLPTLGFLKKAGAKIILLSHLGKPDDNSKLKTKNSKLTLRPVALKLGELLRENVRFVDKCIGRKVKKAAEKLRPGELLLLENLRLMKGEEANDDDFAFSLAELGDVYVGEAFSVCHRTNASVVALPRRLPHFAGFALQKEVEALSRVFRNFERPLVVIIGGKKISSKLKVIERFLEIADHLLFGGKVVAAILQVKGICVGKPWPEKEIIERIEKLKLTNPKIHLPVDVLASPDETGSLYIREAAPGAVRKDEEIFDIGKETILSFRAIIALAKTLFWSGPLGLAENEKFSRGTREIAEAIARNYNAFTVAGGGETAAFLRKSDLSDKFSHVSTGGGAMLTFLAGEKMPGLDALKT